MVPVRILIASTPANGDVNPMLAISRLLMGEGHEIAF
jgi:UDP:flavonoid glycosyltransferase YjiC (YdhE family)